eukprot:gene13557-biopygen14102
MNSGVTTNGVFGSFCLAANQQTPEHAVAAFHHSHDAVPPSCRCGTARKHILDQCSHCCRNAQLRLRGWGQQTAAFTQLSLRDFERTCATLCWDQVVLWLSAVGPSQRCCPVWLPIAPQPRLLRPPARPRALPSPARRLPPSRIAFHIR